jgi:hypothetical protein
MKIVTKEKGKTYILSTREVPASGARVLGNPFAKKILQLLNKEPSYPKQLAKKLKIHEQNIYYYIHLLEKEKIIRVIKQERLQGIMAKWYAPVSDSFFVPLQDFKESSKIEEQESSFLKPFIEQGELNALIIVGSPDPHGPLKARSRDGYFGIDLALFLGTFLNHVSESRVKLDTEIQERDLKENNLIVIGGPIVNKVADTIGKQVPIYFDEEKKGFYSIPSKKLYVHEEIGVINKCKSPFNGKKELIYIAGIRNAGTKAAILAFLKYFPSLEEGNKFNRNVYATVVEGTDIDSDGIVDDVEILE